MAAAAIGGVISLAAWLLIVPWDLSEVDRGGSPVSTGGDEQFAAIGLAFVVVVATGALLALWRPRRTGATAFTIGGCIAWVALFAWRVGASRTDGANLFLLPLVFVVIPAAFVGIVGVALIGRWSGRRGVAT